MHSSPRSRRRSSKFVCGAVALSLTLLAVPAAAQIAFDLERYQALDAAVVAANGALEELPEGTDGWQSAARLAASARGALFEYVSATFNDPALSETDRDALAQVRTTMAIDLVVLSTRLGACDTARSWLAQAEDRPHPALAHTLTRARTLATDCEDPNATPVATTTEPAPTASSSTPAPAAQAAEPSTPHRSSGARTAGFALIGGGVALGAGAIIVDALGASDRKTISDLACGAVVCADPADVAAYNEANQREDNRVVPIIALSAGAVVAGVTGIVLVVKGGHHGESGDVAMTVGWTGTGVNLRW
ncbi:MAG: hypothetical protein H6698_07430 [Myxococcales bacterium]|nr:hypothetical protein [Myxococcales bacterium]